jgi:hypothetical protein
MNWQPVIDQAALWLSWAPWKYLVFALVVWHVMIGRSTAVRWMEALGWNGVMGFLGRIGWIKEPPASEEKKVEETKVTTLLRAP